MRAPCAVGRAGGGKGGQGRAGRAGLHMLFSRSRLARKKVGIIRSRSGDSKEGQYKRWETDGS